jgi:tripeptide aminopeptidase
VVAELPGKGTGKAGRTVVLCAHMDTVEPGRGVVPVVEGGVVRSAGDTVLGGDDKSGIAVILETLRRLVDSGRPHACVRVILTVGEERGLRGAKELDMKDASGDLCLVLDAAGAPGGIVTAAPTHWTFAAVFQGHASHAGVEPEKGRSAIGMAARAITSMRLGRLDPETTANVGIIEGGVATNVVAAVCRLTGEVRSLTAEKAVTARDAMEAAMRSAAKTGGGSVSLSWTKEYDGFRFDDDDPLLELVETACRDANVKPRRFHTGGGSDGNVLTAKGLPTLVLASGMANVHSTSETLNVVDLLAMVRLLDAVLARAMEA